MKKKEKKRKKKKNEKVSKSFSNHWWKRSELERFWYELLTTKKAAYSSVQKKNATIGIL